jgi:hypothetical protein
VRTVNFTHETRVANEALQCITVGCDKQRFGFNPECYDHATVRQRARRESARRAVETRRRNNPDWGRPNDTARYECWKAKAHAIVHLAVEQGILPSLRGGDYACSDCGGVASEYALGCGARLSPLQYLAWIGCVATSGALPVRQARAPRHPGEGGLRWALLVLAVQRRASNWLSGSPAQRFLDSFDHFVGSR